MLSYNGWINGITSMCIVISGLLIGIIFIYKSRKTNAKLLFYMGVAVICIGFGWLGETVDFLTILLTGNNLDNSYGLQGILGYIWSPIIICCCIYIAAELLNPEKKWYLVSPYIVLSIIFDIFLLLDPFALFAFTYPSNPGEDLIGNPLIVGSPLFILLFIFFFSGLIFNGFGLLIKGIQSTGVIRKKFLLISLGFILFVLIAIIDQFDISGIVYIFVRIPILCSFWLWYLGLKEEPAEPEKSRPKKEVIVEKGLFRLIKRPDQITEEEVSISKEKKICLVCKGKLEKFNIYICNKCNTFYCENCARALSKMENMCWACDEPIDESKPVKPFKREEKEIDIKISEKSLKKPKNDKKTS